ncbi:MAG: hypothetical protein EZS28_025314, partial [Streblomastix strix]
QSSFRAPSGDIILLVQHCILTALVLAESIRIRQSDASLN